MLDGELPKVGELRADGADVDEQEKGGTAALMVAVILGHAAIAEMLLAAGAKVDLQDKNGKTALDNHGRGR